MKEVLEKAFNRKTLEPFLIGVGTILLLEYIIFPGLTLANSFINLLCAGISIALIIFIITYLKINLWDFTKVTKTESDDKKKNESEKENKNESIDN